MMLHYNHTVSLNCTYTLQERKNSKDVITSPRPNYYKLQILKKMNGDATYSKEVHSTFTPHAFAYTLTYLTIQDKLNKHAILIYKLIKQSF